MSLFWQCFYARREHLSHSQWHKCMCKKRNIFHNTLLKTIKINTNFWNVSSMSPLRRIYVGSKRRTIYIMQYVLSLYKRQVKRTLTLLNLNNRVTPMKSHQWKNIKSSYKTIKEMDSRFSPSLSGHTFFFSITSSPPSCLALIAVYTERVISCKIVYVIFSPRVWILSRPISSSIAPSLRWLNLNGWMERRSEGGRKRLTAGLDMGIKSCPEESSIHRLLTTALSSRPGHFLCLLTTLEQN